MKEQVKVLINSKKEYKQVKAVLRALGQKIYNCEYDKECENMYFHEMSNRWSLSVKVGNRKEISIRDLIILLTKPEEEKVWAITSEDGIEIRKGNDYYLVTMDTDGKWFYNSHNYLYENHTVVNTPEYAKAFSTKEAALKWISENNKPKSIEVKLLEGLQAIVNEKGATFSDKHSYLAKGEITELYNAFTKLNH